MENENTELTIVDKQKDRDQKYSEALTDLHKRYTPEKWDQVINKDWKKEWGPFLKYDHDWDWQYLVDVIMFKLEKMKLNLTIYNNSTQDWVDRIDKQISEVLDLGHKIQNTDYEEQAFQFSGEHTTPYIIIYKKNPISKDASLAEKLKAGLGTELVRLAVPRVSDPLLHYSQKMKVADKWLKENKIKKSTVSFAFTSEWDDKNNQKIWTKMLKDAEKKKQKDWDKFFLLISRNMRGWWD